ncbi:LOW QUALITY PROTEIN: hypothetical protein MAR_015396 [Mya arenaria]|uniref:Uncharacterized protein n=1 Tax=Mya arenaria TaxID=6604 RepID=A0ABY7FIN1_MYAAR|nr:LOW QUALITY PROTEIN: hypothetical protein MAR_015396 [Mya arenaria]
MVPDVNVSSDDGNTERPAVETDVIFDDLCSATWLVQCVCMKYCGSDQYKQNNFYTQYFDLACCLPCWIISLLSCISTYSKKISTKQESMDGLYIFYFMPVSTLCATHNMVDDSISNIEIYLHLVPNDTQTTLLGERANICDAVIICLVIVLCVTNIIIYNFAPYNNSANTNKTRLDMCTHFITKRRCL